MRCGHVMSRVCIPTQHRTLWYLHTRQSDPVEITITDIEEEDTKAESPPSDSSRSPGGGSGSGGSSGGGAVKALKSSTRAMLRRLASPGGKIFNRLFKKGSNGGATDDVDDSDTSSVGSSTSLRRTGSLTTGDYRDAASRPGVWSSLRLCAVPRVRAYLTGVSVYGGGAQGAMCASR